jgi:hypothetical protein
MSSHRCQKGCWLVQVYGSAAGVYAQCRECDSYLRLPRDWIEFNFDHCAHELVLIQRACYGHGYYQRLSCGRCHASIRPKWERVGSAAEAPVKVPGVWREWAELPMHVKQERRRRR